MTTSGTSHKGRGAIVTPRVSELLTHLPIKLDGFFTSLITGPKADDFLFLAAPPVKVAPPRFGGIVALFLRRN